MGSRLILAAAAATAAISSAANASVLSVNFETNYFATSVAGSAGALPATTWNNEFGDSGTSVTVTDDASNTSTLSWASGGGWLTTPDGGHSITSDGNSELMQNGLGLYTGNSRSFEVDGLPTNTMYNVIVYVTGLDGGSTPDQGNITLGSTTYYTQFTSDLEWQGSSGPYTFGPLSQITSTTAGDYVEGNYVEFYNVSGPSILVNDYSFNGQAALSGFQIQSVPEPTALALTSIVSAGLLVRRRRLCR
jgi:hypothetical protein